MYSFNLCNASLFFSVQYTEAGISINHLQKCYTYCGSALLPFLLFLKQITHSATPVGRFVYTRNTNTYLFVERGTV